MLQNVLKSRFISKILKLAWKSIVSGFSIKNLKRRYSRHVWLKLNKNKSNLSNQWIKTLTVVDEE